MIIQKLRLRNFGPYFGEHELDLRVTREAPLIFIYGENTWGKTSLLNALRWCLYGRARGREGRDKATFRLINADAVRDGDRLMSVVLEFSHDNAQYTLERICTWSQVPTREDQVEEAAFLRLNGQPVASALVADKIGGILNEDIARFFLFDAEMLGEYEMLLENASRAVTDMRREIETVLGLPALRQAAHDIDELHASIQRQLQKSVKKEEQGRQLSAFADQVEDSLRSKRRDRDGISGRLLSAESERDTLLDARARFADLEEAVREMDQVESSLRTNRAAADERSAQMREQVERMWWLPLFPVLVARSIELATAVDEKAAAVREMVKLEVECAAIEQARGADACQACGQDLSIAAKTRLGERLVLLRERLGDARDESVAHLSASTDLARIQPLIAGQSIDGFRQANRDLRRLRLESRRLEQRRTLLSEDLRAHDREDLRRIESDLEASVVGIAKLKEDLALLSGEVKALEESLSRTRREIQKLPAADRALVTEASLLNALAVLFETSISAFREQMRTDVASEATAIFRMITTEEHYQKLSINENYGLVIEDDQGRVVRDRSAGAEQVVAMALVGGLNRCTRREAPMLIDTPFGRLDQGHRDRIISYLPELSRQVIVLPHSGELNRDRDLDAVRHRVAREYRIVRESLRSSFREVR